MHSGNPMHLPRPEPACSLMMYWQLLLDDLYIVTTPARAQARATPFLALLSRGLAFRPISARPALSTRQQEQRRSGSQSWGRRSGEATDRLPNEASLCFKHPHVTCRDRKARATGKECANNYKAKHETFKRLVRTSLLRPPILKPYKASSSGDAFGWFCSLFPFCSGPRHPASCDSAIETNFSCFYHASAAIRET